jgi:hypothetical protein
MATLTVVTKIPCVDIITAMTARAGFAELNTSGHRARVASLALKFKVRAIKLKTSLPVVIEFPE